jgi:hypothetical protein
MLARPLRRGILQLSCSRRYKSTSENPPKTPENKPPPPPKLAPKWLQELLGPDHPAADIYEQAEGLLPLRIKAGYKELLVMNRVGVVYGGAGALGQELIARLKPLKFEVVNIDVKKNEEAAHNILVEGDPVKDSKKVMEWAAKFPGSLLRPRLWLQDFLCRIQRVCYDRVH